MLCLRRVLVRVREVWMNTDKTGLILWRSTTSSRAEAKVCSWQAVTEQDLETNIWRAYIRHLPEGERISSREMFRARGDAELWCRAEIGQRCQVVRFAYRMERPK